MCKSTFQTLKIVHQWYRKRVCKCNPKSFDLVKIRTKSLKIRAKSREIWAKYVETFVKFLKIWTNSLKIRAKWRPTSFDFKKTLVNDL